MDISFYSQNNLKKGTLDHVVNQSAFQRDCNFQTHSSKSVTERFHENCRWQNIVVFERQRPTASSLCASIYGKYQDAPHHSNRVHALKQGGAKKSFVSFFNTL